MPSPHSSIPRRWPSVLLIGLAVIAILGSSQAAAAQANTPTPTVTPTPSQTRTPTATFIRLPTFTPPALIVRPTLLPAQGARQAGGVPPALIIISLFVLGALGGLASLLRRR